LTRDDRDYISRYLNEHCQLFNCYGYTECTGTVIQYLIGDNDVKFVPIERLLTNIHIYLLDKYLQPVIPDVQIGEIVIGGKILFLIKSNSLIN